jgi:hypothetical protein
MWDSAKSTTREALSYLASIDSLLSNFVMLHGRITGARRNSAQGSSEGWWEHLFVI